MRLLLQNHHQGPAPSRSSLQKKAVSRGKKLPYGGTSISLVCLPQTRTPSTDPPCTASLIHLPCTHSPQPRHPGLQRDTGQTPCQADLPTMSMDLLMDTDTHRGDLHHDHPAPPSQAPSDPTFINKMMDIYERVKATGVPNHQGARIPLPRGLNIPTWRRLTADHQDTSLIDLLEYGFPLGYEGPIPTLSYSNHMSATCYPDHVQAYLQTETSAGAMLGPFRDLPFSWTQISPLMTRPKRNSYQRRIIVDLSYPPGGSVNHFTPKDTYCGQLAKVKLPSVDDLAKLISDHNGACYLFSVDIARAYRNIPIDPLSWPLAGIQFDSQIYIDISQPFGSRWSAHACQRMTDAIRLIMAKHGFTILNYIDDLCGICTSAHLAAKGFNLLRSLLHALGLPEATSKTVAPTRILTWIGVQFDCTAGQIKIPNDKLQEISQVVTNWQKKSTANLKQLRSLLGKLLHISQCCKPARLFLNRMLYTLRTHNNEAAPMQLNPDFHKDLAWFHDYLATSNGVFIIQPTPSKHTIHTYASTSSAGATHQLQRYHTPLPEYVLRQNLSPCHLAALNCLISIKVWKSQLENKTALLYCNSAATATALTSARSRDPFLLTIAREIWLLGATHNIHIIPTHDPSTDMDEAADALSHYHLSGKHKEMADLMIKHNNLSIIDVDPYLFKLQTNL